MVPHVSRGFARRQRCSCILSFVFRSKINLYRETRYLDNSQQPQKKKSGKRTTLKHTLWVCGTNPSTLERQNAFPHQIGQTRWIQKWLGEHGPRDFSKSRRFGSHQSTCYDSFRTKNDKIAPRTQHIHERPFVEVSQKSIFKIPCHFFGDRCPKLAPRTTQWLQERPWNAPTKGFLWKLANAVGMGLAQNQGQVRMSGNSIRDLRNEV